MRLPLFAAFILISSSLFSQKDTIRNNVNANIIVEEFDDYHVLRSSCYYADDTFNKLLMESVYLPNGKEMSHVIWYWNGLEQNIFTLNPATGKTDFTEIDSSGNVIERSEDSDTISDSKCYLYFSGGMLKANGFRKLCNVYEVGHLDSEKVGVVQSVIPIGMDEVKTGLWHYYYQNGVDSASGSYYPISYQSEESFPGDSIYGYDSVAGIFAYCIMLSNRYNEIKTGTWNYFSPDGKLIRREKWDKGNLIRREVF
jgi:hypothetical protein